MTSGTDTLLLTFGKLQVDTQGIFHFRACRIKMIHFARRHAHDSLAIEILMVRKTATAVGTNHSPRAMFAVFAL